MKFSAAIFFTVPATASAFQPHAGISHASPMIATRPEFGVASYAGSTSQLQLRLPFFSSETAEASPAQSISKDEVRGLFSLWNNALATGNSALVAKRYAKDAVLLPTVSDIPRTDYALIKDYFDA